MSFLAGLEFLGAHVGMPAVDYHAAPGVSKSQLDRLAKSPAHLMAYLAEPRAEPTQPMIVGTLTHLALFEPEKCGDGVSHHTRPDGMNFQTKEGKAWRESHQDKPIISPDEDRSIWNTVDAIGLHPMACLILAQGTPELSLFALHEPTGILRKGRLDWVTKDGNGKACICDLKTTDDARLFERKCGPLRYHVQAAYYTDMLTEVQGTEAFFLFIVVERDYPHGVRIVQLDDEAIQAGRAVYRRDLARYAECQRACDWPGYSEEIETVSLPKWAHYE